MALIYVDMDNVIVDFKSALRKRGLPEDTKNADDTCRLKLPPPKKEGRFFHRLFQSIIASSVILTVVGTTIAATTTTGTGIHRLGIHFIHIF